MNLIYNGDLKCCLLGLVNLNQIVATTTDEAVEGPNRMASSSSPASVIIIIIILPAYRFNIICIVWHHHRHHLGYHVRPIYLYCQFVRPIFVLFLGGKFFQIRAPPDVAADEPTMCAGAAANFSSQSSPANQICVR